MQLSLDANDRLIELLEEHGPTCSASEAARRLFAAASVPDDLACSLLSELVAGDDRFVWHGASVSLVAAPADPLLEQAEFIVFDLETTGLSSASSRICELGAVRVRALEVVECFESLIAPGVPLPESISRLTGLRDKELRQAPSAASVVRRFVAFAGDAALAAHNARFDLAFLNRQLELIYGRRHAGPTLDTVGLARRLLEGRIRRVSLASLAQFFGTSAEPCHRALPDAQATAEILIQLIGLAQERGARRLSELRALEAPRRRRVFGKRSLAHGAPTRPGVYLFRDRNEQVLYVGRARDLRARLRSYFRSERLRPSVEAALGAVERIEWTVLGSELEAALEELKLIRELRPPANARGKRSDRYVYLRRRGADVVVSGTPTPIGPITSRRRASLATRALAGCTDEEWNGLLRFGGPLPRLRAKLRDLSDCLRYEDAARLRDRIAALEAVVGSLRRLERLRSARVCLVVPAVQPGWLKAFFVAEGRIYSVRPLPPGPGSSLEIEAGIALACRTPEAPGSNEPEWYDELICVGSFLHRPPPELSVFPLDAGAIRNGVERLRERAAVAA
jgi:DNA polymerase III epsilon subunit family exonuclease